jgi:hypothetical protein
MSARKSDSPDSQSDDTLKRDHPSKDVIAQGSGTTIQPLAARCIATRLQDKMLQHPDDFLKIRDPPQPDGVR